MHASGCGSDFTAMTSVTILYLSPSARSLNTKHRSINWVSLTRGHITRIRVTGCVPGSQPMVAPPGRKTIGM